MMIFIPIVFRYNLVKEGVFTYYDIAEIRTNNLFIKFTHLFFYRTLLNDFCYFPKVPRTLIGFIHVIYFGGDLLCLRNMNVSNLRNL